MAANFPTSTDLQLYEATASLLGFGAAPYEEHRLLFI